MPNPTERELSQRTDTSSNSIKSGRYVCVDISTPNTRQQDEIRRLNEELRWFKSMIPEWTYRK